MQLLIQNRALHPDHVRRIASKWNLGTGRELLSYTPSLYAEIFGLEDAWMVYKDAKVFILTQKNKGKLRVRCKLFVSVSLVMAMDTDTHLQGSCLVYCRGCRK